MNLRLYNYLTGKSMLTKSIYKFKIAAILIFFFISATVFSQKESIVYFGTNGKLTTLSDAISMQKITAKSSRIFKIQTYMLRATKWEIIGTEQYKKLNDSTFQIYAKGIIYKGIRFRNFSQQADESFKFKDVANGRILRTGYAKSIMPLLLQGQVTEYYLNGNKKSISNYDNNELGSNENWKENGEKYIDNVFYSVDTYPTFIPGNKEIYIQILKAFKDADIDVLDISGSLSIGFVVMENGTIDGIKIIKGLRPFINRIALKSFGTLKGTWTPARLNSKTVRYFQVYPINFIIKKRQFNYAEVNGNLLQYAY